MAKPFRKLKGGFLPSQRLQAPQKTYRIHGIDVLKHLAGPMAEPMKHALEAFEKGELGTALHWFGECAKIDPMNKAVLYFGSEAAQRAYFALKLASPAPPPEKLEQWRHSALNLSMGLMEAFPEPVVIHNVARFIQDDGDDAAAIPMYEQCVKEKRDQVETWGNLGTAYFRLGQRENAERSWSKCVAFPAENASGHLAQAYIWIRRGEWQKGWKALNMRWADKTFLDSYGRKDLNKLGQPWNGQPLKKDARLLLHGEQGLGDHVMFARYIPLLKAAGYTIAGFETRRALKGWFDACWLGCPVVVRDEDILPPFTHHVPIMSLPGILGLAEPPAPVGPPADPSVARATIGHSGKRRIGLVWKGTRGNVMDAQRSIPDEALVALADVPNVEWVPLQYDPTGELGLTAQMWLGESVVLPPKFEGVLELAELMRTLDHVVTVDTLHAHVAGSIGVPSTVIHRYHREWRWGIDTDTTPWYPNQRLVTCQTPDAWDGALREAVATIPTTALTPSVAPRPRRDSVFSFPAVEVQGRHGPLWVSPHDQFVGKSLIEYGEFSKGEGDLFADLVKSTWRVTEVGANCGAHTHYLAQIAAHVIAYEPHPNNCALLRANAPTATVRQAAVGKQPGETTIDDVAFTHTGNFGGLRVGRGGIVVPLVTLTDPADFLKLDCEGMELDVLQGALSLLESRPVIYAEADHKSTAEPLIGFLRGLGYRLHWHAPKLFHPHNFKRNTVNVFGDIQSVNLLATPKTQPVPVDAAKHGLMAVETTRIQLIP